MTIRAPLYTPLRRGRGIVHDVLNGNLLETTLAAPAVQRPFQQFDWPNPAARKKTSVELLTWIQGLSLDALAIVPTRQLEWPNPKRHLASLELQTWVNPGLQNQPVVAAPFLPPDFPNPQRGRSFGNFGFDQNLLGTTLAPPVVSGTPFIPLQWENPTSTAVQFLDAGYNLTVLLPPGPTPGPSGRIGGDDVPHDGHKRKRRRDERRRADIETAFAALTASPDPEVVQRALDIVRPEAQIVSADYGAFDLLGLTSPKVGELLSLWREEQERAELIELLEILH